MNRNNENAYRSAAASGATHIGLLMLVYDALAVDLLGIGEAIQRGDVQERCRKSNHAFLLLAHLESWIQLLDDPRLATSLQHFYGHLRASIVHLQSSRDRNDCDHLAKQVCETRAVWQKREQDMLSNRGASGDTTRPMLRPSQDDGSTSNVRASWSA